MGEWIGAAEAAEIMEVSVRLVQMSLADDETANREWGSANWRLKPLARRRSPQVRREAAERKAEGATS